MLVVMWPARTPIRPVLALSAIATLLAGCGSSSSSSGSESSPTTTEVTEAAPELPAGAVAVVSHTSPAASPIRTADLNKAIEQQATQHQTSVPSLGDSAYAKLAETALAELLDQAWIEGEAEELGIAVTDRQIELELGRIKKQAFPTEASYRKFLISSKFTEEDVHKRVRLQLLSQEVQRHVIAGLDKAEKERGLAEFIRDYQRRWRSRTTCTPELAIARCSNGPEPK
jgi:hypothetical protein